MTKVTMTIKAIKKLNLIDSDDAFFVIAFAAITFLPIVAMIRFGM